MALLYCRFLIFNKFRKHPLLMNLIVLVMSVIIAHICKINVSLPVWDQSSWPRIHYRLHTLPCTLSRSCYRFGWSDFPARKKFIFKCKELKQKVEYPLSLASKPIKIRFINTGSQPY